MRPNFCRALELFDIDAFQTMEGLLLITLLIGTGIVSGFINTLAGGGSMITLPALMIMGMPADVANATNRVGVLMQSVTSVKGFDSQGYLDRRSLWVLLLITGFGALGGAVLASVLPVWILKPVLLITMIIMALIMLIRPEVVVPPDGTIPRRLSENSMAAFGLFMSGVYGGFVQAGVGFILIAALSGGLRYDLIRTNALKSVCTAVFSGLALLVFAFQGQVWWIPGLILALGSIAGAWLGVRVTLQVAQNTLKWFLFTMVCATCAGALFF